MIYQNVSPGEKVVNSAQRYNDINRLLNAAHGVNESFSAGRDFSKIKVYNANSETLLPGWAVMFVPGRIIDGACPVERATNKSYRYGVLTEKLYSFCFGTAVVSGPAEVEFLGSGEYALPSADGKKFASAASGLPVLCISDGRAVILLGGNGVTDEYKGYFALEILEQTDEDKKNDQLRVRVHDSLKYGPYCGFAEINGKTFRFDNEILLVSRAIPYIVLRHDADSNAADIRAVSSIYSDTPRYHDYIIGELVFDEKDAKVVQRHRNGNGVIKMWITTATCLWEEQNVY